MLDKKKFIDGIQRASLVGAGEAFAIIALIEIRESVDRYIEQRIKSDKVLEGILKDIHGTVQESISQD